MRLLVASSYGVLGLLESQACERKVGESITFWIRTITALILPM